MTTKNIQDVVAEKVEGFNQYCNDGYNGGKEGLRCSECDRKYRGEAAMLQLCPVCNARTTLTQLVKEVEAGERQAIKDILQGMEASQTAHNSEYVWSVNATLDIAIREINKRSTPPTSDVIEK